MEKEKIQSILESLLFVAAEPLPLKKMCEVIPEAKKKEVKSALQELIQKYESEGRGLRVVEVADGYQLQTAAENASWVGRLLQTRPARLSRPSLETLAIIAYKQPVTRTEIEEIRGVDSGGVLKTLLDYGFIKIVGRKDVPGKPLIYATDRKFMEFFRLKSLSELPTLRDLEEIQEQRLAEAEDQEPRSEPADQAEEGETSSSELGEQPHSSQTQNPEESSPEDETKEGEEREQ